MSPLRFFSIRLAASSALLILAFSLIRGLWYPGAYFDAAGTLRHFLILTAVAIVVGPVLTTAVFRPGKWGMKFDVIALGVAEILIVAVGACVLYLRQPYYVVFAVDRFEMVTQQDVDPGDASDAGIRRRPGHTPRLVFSRLPDDAEALSRLIEETMFEGKPDIDRRPEFWQIYVSGVAAVKSAGKPLRDLLAASDRRARHVQLWLNTSHFDVGELVYLPLRGRASDVTMVLHADIGYPVATLPVDPW